MIQEWYLFASCHLIGSDGGRLLAGLGTVGSWVNSPGFDSFTMFR